MIIKCQDLRPFEKGKFKKEKLGSGPSNGNSGTGLANSALFSAANTLRL
jgi:hypothetical protein